MLTRTIVLTRRAVIFSTTLESMRRKTQPAGFPGERENISSQFLIIAGITAPTQPKPKPSSSSFQGTSNPRVGFRDRCLPSGIGVSCPLIHASQPVPHTNPPNQSSVLKSKHKKISIAHLNALPQKTHPAVHADQRCLHRWAPPGPPTCRAPARARYVEAIQGREAPRTRSQQHRSHDIPGMHGQGPY